MVIAKRISVKMASCGDFIKSQFPLIDEELKKYVEGMVYEVIKYKSLLLFLIKQKLVMYNFKNYIEQLFINILYNFMKYNY